MNTCTKCGLAKGLHASILPGCMCDWPTWPSPDHVICPKCTHQFRAIPENVQQLMLDAGFEPPFTTPPQLKPLTRQQINQMMADAGWQNSALRQADLDKVEKVARAIEAAHNIKE